ncbi:MAG TPA: exodeoxyribonuclease VII small subunit [Humisphaera sp.]
MATKKSAQPASPPKSFEEALRELEGILQQIEGGELGLEDSLSKYERGNFLIQHCRGVLNAAEKQIELVSGSAEGGVTTSPLAVEGEDDEDDDAEDEE